MGYLLRIRCERPYLEDCSLSLAVSHANIPQAKPNGLNQDWCIKGTTLTIGHLYIPFIVYTVMTRTFPLWRMLGQPRWEQSPWGATSLTIPTGDTMPAGGQSQLENPRHSTTHKRLEAPRATAQPIEHHNTICPGIDPLVENTKDIRHTAQQFGYDYCFTQL